MKADRSKKYLIVAVIALVVIVLDQLTKHLIIRSFALHQSLDIIQNYVTIVHARNKGIAFGIFAARGSGAQTILLVITSCLAISFIFYLVKSLQGKQLFATITLSLILGGAAGNLIDRIRWGEVIDFIDIHWHHYHWPAFNVADSAISLGLVLLLIGLFTKKFPS